MEDQLKDISVAHLHPVQTQLVGEKEEAQGVLELIDQMPLENQGDYDFAAEILTEVKGKKKGLETERGKATRPMLDALNVVRGWFKPAIEYYGRCETKIKRRMTDYMKEQRRKQEEALQVAGQASMAGNKTEARQALAQASAAEVHKAKGVSTRDVLKYEVVDASQVPREFLTVDHGAVQLYISVHGETTQIPGIRVFRDIQMSARSR